MVKTAPVSDPRYQHATFISPSTLGYIHIAAEVEPDALLQNPQQAAD